LSSHVTERATPPSRTAINGNNVNVSPNDSAVPATTSIHYPDPDPSRNACSEPNLSSSIYLRPEFLLFFPKAAGRKRKTRSRKRTTAILRNMPVKAALRNIQNSKEGIKLKGNRKGNKGRLFNKSAKYSNN
jgi:hypothetical protein